jgi:DNA-binding transcriptional regulator YdaS (Cro superfamily)
MYISYVAMNMKQVVQSVGYEKTAKAVGVSIHALKHWVYGTRRVPSKRVLGLCAASNWAIKPHDLRPDIYPNQTDGLPDSMRQKVFSECFHKPNTDVLSNNVPPGS